MELRSGMRDAGVGLRDAGYEMRDAGYEMREAGSVLRYLITFNYSSCVLCDNSVASVLKLSTKLATKLIQMMDHMFVMQ